MADRNCADCGYPIVAQSQLAAALAEGQDVRAHEGRGLCRKCYTRARHLGKREEHPQVSTGDRGLRGYTSSPPGRTDGTGSPAGTPRKDWTPAQRRVAQHAATNTPHHQLRDVLAALGLTP